jgi:hypothetical protein
MRTSQSVFSYQKRRNGNAQHWIISTIGIVF